MSFSASLRRCAPQATRSLRQQATTPNAAASSSTAHVLQNKKRQTRTLPREKLRALVSMYHQADTFITQDNLLDKINEALLKEPARDGSLPEPKMPTQNQMYAVMERRRDAPRLTDMSDESRMLKNAADYDSLWSSVSKASRERRVVEALYGVNMSSKKGARPGLEAVEAAIAQMENN